MNGARLLVVVALLAGTSNASGESPKSTNGVAADALFRAALTAKDGDDWDAACPKFLESQKLEPAAGTLLYLSQCHERGGRLGSAWEAVRDAIYLMPSTDERLTRAKQRLAALEKSAPKLKIRLGAGTPAGSTVNLDGQRISSENLGAATPVDAGEHLVVVMAPGRPDSRRAVIVAQRENAEVVIDAVGVDGSAPTTPPSGSAPAGSGNRMLGYTLLSVGTAGIIVAAVTGAILVSKHAGVADHCDTAARTCDSSAGVDAAKEGASYVPWNVGGLVVGAVGVGVGSYLLLSSNAGATTTLRVGPLSAAFARRFLSVFFSRGLARFFTALVAMSCYGDFGDDYAAEVPVSTHAKGGAGGAASGAGGTSSGGASTRCVGALAGCGGQANAGVGGEAAATGGAAGFSGSGTELPQPCPPMMGYGMPTGTVAVGMGSSAAMGDPHAMVDCNLATSWSEGDYSGSVALTFPAPLTLTAIQIAGYSDILGSVTVTVTDSVGKTLGSGIVTLSALKTPMPLGLIQFSTANTVAGLHIHTSSPGWLQIPEITYLP